MFVDRYHKTGKSLLDLLLVIPALIILAPVMGLVALLIRLTLGAPVLFRQQRPGLYGQPFTILKFRTMTNTYDRNGRLLPDAERLTALGRFLRRSSLDELPELLNVLKGDMSLVGPRPLMMRYLNRYDPEQMRRHDVKPGVTGWAQINGRNALSWEERLRLDTWYVDHLSLGLDLKILWLTIWTVLKREGINHPGHVTMEEFTGSAHNKRNSADAVGWVEDYDARSAGRQRLRTAEQAFSPEFRAQSVLDVISGVKRVEDLCREFKLDPQLLARWQADFLENAAKAFQKE